MDIDGKIHSQTPHALEKIQIMVYRAIDTIGPMRINFWDHLLALA